MYYYIMYVLGRLRRRFMHQIPENNAHYVRSRRAFVVDGITATAIATLVSGTYLAGYLKLIGVSEVLNGIISALPALASVSQPLGAVFSQKLQKRKPLVCLGALLHRLIFAFLFFISVITGNTALKITLVFLLLCSAHFIAGFISPAASSWIISLTPQKIRGRYFSARELYTIIFLSVLTLSSGYVLDFFSAAGNGKGGFMVLGIFIGILTIVNFISLSMAMEPENIEVRKSEGGFFKAVKTVVTDKGFRPVLIMWALYQFGIQIAVPYHGIYLVGGLNISYTVISMVTFAAFIERALIVRRWGRLADKTSWAYVCRLSIGLVAVSYLLNAFLLPSNAHWLYPVNALIGGAGWAAIGIAIFNVQYDYAPVSGRTLYVGVNNAITGLIGFCGVFCGSFIMRLTQLIRPQIFGTDVKGQQILMLISGIILSVCAWYIGAVLENKEKAEDNCEEIAL